MKKNVFAPLARSGLHLAAGVLFLLVFTWPFLTFTRPRTTWIYLHLGWIAALALLAVLGWADKKVEGMVEEEDQGRG